jgi:hypothetical protein
VRVFTDYGISGAKGRAARKGLDDLLKAVVRREVDQVCVWSIVWILIGLGNGRASTPSCSASQKLKREIWLAMTDIGEEKSPLYIFIYAS